MVFEVCCKRYAAHTVHPSPFGIATYDDDIRSQLLSIHTTVLLSSYRCFTSVILRAWPLCKPPPPNTFSLNPLGKDCCIAHHVMGGSVYAPIQPLYPHTIILLVNKPLTLLPNHQVRCHVRPAVRAEFYTPTLIHTINSTLSLCKVDHVGLA